MLTDKHTFLPLIPYGSFHKQHRQHLCNPGIPDKGIDKNTLNCLMSLSHRKRYCTCTFWQSQTSTITWLRFGFQSSQVMKSTINCHQWGVTCIRLSTWKKEQSPHFSAPWEIFLTSVIGLANDFPFNESISPSNKAFSRTSNTTLNTGNAEDSVEKNNHLL